jgi:prepilin-type N-terminal cleavage/methylation domain-containing protein
MKSLLRTNNHRRGSSGWTLMELLVAIAIGALLMALLSGFWVYSLRSFVAMSNYADLDEKSRRTVDEMTRQIRQATAVLDIQNTGNTRWITLTNSTPGATNKFVKYTWDTQTKVFYYQSTTQSQITNLTECDNWEFGLYQRNPIPGLTNMFYPATNSAGKLDFTVAKLVEMKWHCTREMLGKTFQTESVQTTKIVLRNRK